MAAIRQLRQRRFNVVPAPFVLKTALDQFGNEGASTAGTGTLVQFGDQRIWQSYAYSHGLSVATTRYLTANPTARFGHATGR